MNRPASNNMSEKFGSPLLAAIAVGVFGLVSVGCGPVGGDDPVPILGEAPPAEAIHFDEHFVAEDTIRLSSDVLLSSISLDMDEGGRMVVTDTWSQLVALYDEEGSYIRTLDPEPCDPQLAIDWMPRASIFLSDGRIFVNNNGPAHAVFDTTGECVETHMLMHQDRRIASGPDGGYYMLRSVSAEREDENQGLYFDHFDQRGTLLRSRLIADTKPEMYARFTSGGMTSDTGGALFVADFADPYVDHFSAEGEHLARLGFVPSYFRRIDGDARSMSDVQRLMNSGTAVMGLHLLDDAKLMIVYDNRHLIETNPEERIGIVVMDREGRSLLPGEMLSEFVPIRYASGGYIYFQEGPEAEEDNPYLVRYRFVK